MLGNQKWKYLKEIAKPYALDILEELQKKPMRFSELKKICLSQKTLTVRLHELEEVKVIQTIIEKPKSKSILFFDSKRKTDIRNCFQTSKNLEKIISSLNHFYELF